MAKYYQLAAEVAVFTLAALLAWALRIGPDIVVERFQSILPYLLVSMAVGALIFQMFRLHLHFYRFFSFHDLAHIMLAVTVAVLVVVLVSFAIYRLDDVHRSLPFMHGIFALTGITLLRFVGMLLGLHMETRSLANKPNGHIPTLIIGYTPAAEICLRAMPVFGRGDCFVVGILDESPRRLGQRLRHTQVIGHPTELQQVLSDMAIHGVVVKKLILACPRESLSPASRKVLKELEQARRIQVHDFRQHISQFFEHVPEMEPEREPVVADAIALPAEIARTAERNVTRYMPLKRSLDIVLALLLGAIMFPIMLALVPLIWLSMGKPFYFWQERPGRQGRIFRLYKLRTLSHGVDGEGAIIADAQRQTRLGHILRRTRLDEIPQLYNVLIGDMSFVGPRPLLPIDLPPNLPSWARLRCLTRPGLTGWAQINGGQEVSMEDKVVMDVWYLTHMSLWTDLRIIWGTVKVVLRGEMLDQGNINASYRDLGISRKELSPESHPGQTDTRQEAGIRE